MIMRYLVCLISAGFHLLPQILHAQNYLPEKVIEVHANKWKTVLISEAILDGIEGSEPEFNPVEERRYYRNGFPHEVIRYSMADTINTHYTYARKKRNWVKLTQLRNEQKTEISLKIEPEHVVHVAKNTSYADELAIYDYNEEWQLTRQVDSTLESDRRLTKRCAYRINEAGNQVQVCYTATTEKTIEIETVYSGDLLIEKRYYRPREDLYLIKKYTYNENGELKEAKWFQPYYTDPFRIYRYTISTYWWSSSCFFR